MAESLPRADRYLRFTLSDRMEHWAQIGTFVPLAITGLVQRYSEAALSKGIIDLLGGIESTRTIHRIFAGLLMVAVVYHLGGIGYRRFVLDKRREMGINRSDLEAAVGTIAYLLGRRDDRPEQGRYTFEEKVEYWSLVWGTALMIVTGFMLWNPIATAKLLPGEFIPASKSVHGFEAVLAVLAILVWHIYHVHVRHFNRSMFTGYVSREEMLRYHPLELRAAAADPPGPAELRQRRRRYLPTFSAAGIVLLGGIYLFVTFEDTAIETIEPIEQPVVFSPVTTTTTPIVTPTSASTTTEPATVTTVDDGGTTTTAASTTTAPVAASWDDVAAILAPSCGTCHGASATGGLDVSTYESALAGGGSGPGIVPGDPDASLIVVTLSGSHPGTLDDEELAAVTDWITAGAPEVAPAGTNTTTTTAGTGEASAWADFAPIFEEKCGACHDRVGPIADLDLSRYESAVAGGDTGPGIVPGDPDASQIVITQLADGHPGQLTDTEITLLVDWIEDGAPED